MPQGDKITTILCICVVPALAETQRLLLEQHGYRVLPATNFREIEDVTSRVAIDCALVSADIEPRMKRAIGAFLQEKFPYTAILEVCRISPEMENVPYVLAEKPEDIVNAVDDLLQPHGRRHTEFVQRLSSVVLERARQTVENARKAREETRQLRTKHKSGQEGSQG